MLDELVRTHHAPTYRLALILTKNPRDAEEVTQEAFRAVLARHADEAADELRSWLYRTATHGALMRLRKHRTRQQLLADDLLPRFFESGRLEKTVVDWSSKADASTHKVVHAAVEGLPEKYRWILSMRDVEHMSLDDIALALGMSLGAVKSILHRSRMYVREMLNQHFEAAV